MLIFVFAAWLCKNTPFIVPTWPFCFLFFLNFSSSTKISIVYSFETTTQMEENKDSIIELGQVPPSREARARSMSYSKPASAAAVAAALESSAAEGYESDMDSPHTKQRKSTHQMAMGVVILVQLLSICLTVVFYKKWYAITPYGSSALVSCLLCGFSQGLLQLIVYRRAQPVNLLKFYTWGVVNGIWTVCFFHFFPIIFSIEYKSINHLYRNGGQTIYQVSCPALLFEFSVTS